jgi:hypothetical protein
LGHQAADNASSAAGRSPEAPFSGQNAHGVNWLVSIARLGRPVVAEECRPDRHFLSHLGVIQANAWDVLALPDEGGARRHRGSGTVYPASDHLCNDLMGFPGAQIADGD